ncbi:MULTISPECIES: ABC transporter permease [Aminobacter]|uniref:ABC transporter permease n=1 Tax=Aminobacter TaxID=31988 RepID=UPI0012B0CBE8|nr:MULTISPECIES: ABC transporter permease [Aminobacter]MDR7224628.1 ribose/xylose/arabinose/galactoside ABC-type transport system permease subunit [Aminobacter aminovorans]MRX37310.1 ABC transporter permease [Aminobacter sp. MDW-2]QNH33919.1 ABC transporter permease [Aminobacter sp. MDW-2]
MSTKAPSMTAPVSGSRYLRAASQTSFLINNILLGTLIAMVLYFTYQSSAFLTVSNFTVILTNYAAIGVVVAAMAILVIAGHVDLSVGSNIAFSGMISAVAITKFGVSPPIAILAGVLTGSLIGAINGFLCGILRFNPIIVTLGMLSFLRGVTLLINPTEVYGLGDTFFFIGNGRLLGVPILLLIVATCFILSAVFMSKTVWGRYVYAVGVNPHAAFLAALPVKRLLVSLYIATGAAAGSAGVLLASRLDGVSPGALGVQMELQALTIVLLGGVAFAGGRGRIFGVVTAWIFLGVLENGLTLLNVPPFIQLVASGLALVLAASLDALGSYLGPRMAQRAKIAEQLEKANMTK